MASKYRIVVVVGTRPEAIKMIPVLRELRASSVFEPFLLLTGQHRDLVRPLMERAQIPINAEVVHRQTDRTLNDTVLAVERGVDATLRELQGADPDEGLAFTGALLVHGDTTSAMAGALAAMTNRVPVVHVEAGLRTRNPLSPWPEELNRQIIGRIAALHLAPTRRNLGNLVREAINEEQIMVTGNTGIDALMWAAEQQPEWTPQLADFVENAQRLVVVTAHRRESWGTGLDGVARGVRMAAEHLPDVRFVVPMHPNPIVRSSLVPVLSQVSNVLLTEPLEYIDFAGLLKCADLVITDSGGIQEEAPTFHLPVLVAREETERIEGIDAGVLRLVGTNSQTICEQTVELLTDPEAYRRMAEADNPYGDGKAATRIVQTLENLARLGPPPTPFGAGYSRSAVLEAAGYGQYDRAASTNRPPDWTPPEHGEWFDEPSQLQSELREAVKRHDGGAGDRRVGVAVVHEPASAPQVPQPRLKQYSDPAAAVMDRLWAQAADVVREGEFAARRIVQRVETSLDSGQVTQAKEPSSDAG